MFNICFCHLKKIFVYQDVVIEFNDLYTVVPEQKLNEMYM